MNPDVKLCYIIIPFNITNYIVVQKYILFSHKMLTFILYRLY